MKLTKKHVEEYNNNGFIIIREFIKYNECDILLTELNNYMADQGVKFGWLKNEDCTLKETILNTMRIGTPERTFIYDLMRYLPMVGSLINSSVIVKLLKELGLSKPICMEVPSIRFDIKGEEKFLTKPHQDIRSIRSKKCVTVWLPITKCDKHYGSLGVYPRTHTGGIIPYDIKEGHMEINTKYLNNEIIVDVMPGDLVLMNSMTVHKSVQNHSEEIKINLQAFYNDLTELHYKDDYFNLNKIKDYKDLI